MCRKPIKCELFEIDFYKFCIYAEFIGYEYRVTNITNEGVS